MKVTLYPWLRKGSKIRKRGLDLRPTYSPELLQFVRKRVGREVGKTTEIKKSRMAKEKFKADNNTGSGGDVITNYLQIEGGSKIYRR